MKKLLAAALCLFASASHAEQFQKLGDYIVHYSAFNSTVLTPQVAQQYGLTRSKFQGVLNIAVQKPAGEQSPAVTARIAGKVKNEISQVQDLSFREVKEGEAIYYLASFNHPAHAKLSFDLQIQGEGRGETRTLKFSQEFFAD